MWFVPSPFFVRAVYVTGESKLGGSGALWSLDSSRDHGRGRGACGRTWGPTMCKVGVYVLSVGRVECRSWGSCIGESKEPNGMG